MMALKMKVSQLEREMLGLEFGSTVIATLTLTVTVTVTLTLTLTLTPNP